MQIAIIRVPTLSNKENIANGSLASALIVKAFKKATFIPDNATNGDIIKALFPEVFVTNCKCVDKVGYFNFDADWWNAPYKAEVEPQESEDKE